MFPNFGNFGLNPLGMPPGTGHPTPNLLPNPGAGNFPPGMIAAPPIISGGLPLGTLPGMLPAGFPNPLLSGVINPLMAGGANPFLRPNSAQPGTIQQNTTAEVVKKVFVKNIPPDVSDTFMELLLKDCGPLVSWKRTRNEKDIPVSFGVCEFEDVEGVLRCLRIMNNLELLNNKVQIKLAEKTELYIKEWKEEKRKEWEEYQKQKMSADPNSIEEDFESSLQKDDDAALNKILLHIEAFDVNKVREAKEREEEKKEHPRERERENKKRQLQKDNERAYKKKLSEWLQREENKERERKREREREKEKIKERQRLLEKELNYDSEEEKRKNSKNPKYQEERKKARQKEMEEDEIERKRMQQEELMRQEAENQPPLENILPQEPESTDMNVEAPKVEKPKQRKKFVFSSIAEANEDSQQQEHDGQRMQLEGSNQRPGFTSEAGSVSFNLSLAKNQKGPNLQANSAFAKMNQDMEEEDTLYSRKHKPLSILDRSQDQNIAAIKANNQGNGVEEEKGQSEAQSQPGEQTAANVQVNKPVMNEDIKRELEKIISKIPKSKNELFEFPINWTLLAKSDLTEKKIKPWVSQKCKEYIGAEEINFINMILKKLVNRDSPNEILKKVSIVLEDDAEDFVIKMWRMIIFELLKLESNIGA